MIKLFISSNKVRFQWKRGQFIKEAACTFSGEDAIRDEIKKHLQGKQDAFRLRLFVRKWRTLMKEKRQPGLFPGAKYAVKESKC